MNISYNDSSCKIWRLITQVFCLFLCCSSLLSCGSGSGGGSASGGSSTPSSVGGNLGSAGPVILAPAVFQNPYMAPNDFSEIHLNSFQTDTGSVAGPGRQSGLAVGQIPVAVADSVGIAGTIAFNSQGQIITIRTAPNIVNGSIAITQTMMLIDPVSSQILDRLSLPSGPKSTNGVSFSGGGYFYLNSSDEVVCITYTQEIRIYKVVNNQFVLDKSLSLATALNDPAATLNSVLPDSAGNLWFITKTGVVGYVDRSTLEIHVTTLGNGETNSKSFSTDADGNVFAVSDYALYSFTIGTDRSIQTRWRSPYNRGTRIKSGQNQQGCGTTPTLFDDANGNKFVAIADNADPYLHINIYNRSNGNLIAQQAVFSSQPYTNSTENSLIAVNHSVLVENNYGNDTPESTLGRLTTAPGFDRVDFDLNGNSSVVWSNMDIAVPSIVSQLSTGDGLLYTYAKDANGWYWAALDFNTGSIVARTYVLGLPFEGFVGDILANNYYGGLTIGPDHKAYAGVFGGFVSWYVAPPAS